MAEFKSNVDGEVHKQLAIELFHLVWALIEKRDRDGADDEMMVNAAHASRFHWGLVGKPLHIARGEWQISRVYCLLGRAEPALHHAKKSVQWCKDHQLGEFDLGFGYEGLARSYAVKGDLAKRDTYLDLARKCAKRVPVEEDRMWLLNNIDSVSLLLLPEWS